MIFETRNLAILILPLLLSHCAESEFSSGSSVKKSAKAQSDARKQPDPNRLPEDGDSTSEDANGLMGGINSSSGKVECKSEEVVDDKATFKTPIPESQRTGDMGRDSVSPATKNALAIFAGKACVAGFASGSGGVGESASRPSLSADKATRDAVCKLYGYVAATDDNQFGYFGYSSPQNNYAAVYKAAEKRLVGGPTADKAPTNNKILLWTSCRGKVSDSCTKKFKDEFKCSL